MRYSTLLIVMLSLLAHTSAPAPQGCPQLAVESVESVRVGTPLVFTATHNAAVAGDALTYTWTVSAGIITEGQGTKSITVDTTGVGAVEVVATVEISGLPSGCRNTASFAVHVVSEPVCRCTLDEYGRISFEDEKARLDNLAIEMENLPDATAYIIGYDGRVSREGGLRKRLERARKYLIDVRNIDGARIVTVQGGYRHDLTFQLFLVPAGRKPPVPMLTIDESDVRFVEKEEQPQKKRRRRQP